MESICTSQALVCGCVCAHARARVISWRDQNLGNVGHFWTEVRTVCPFGKRRDNRREADGDQIAEVRERQDQLSFLIPKTAGLSH